MNEIQSCLAKFHEEHNIPRLNMDQISTDELNRADKKYQDILYSSKMEKFLRSHNKADLEIEPSQLDEFPVEHYCRSWCKLSKQQKINRLMNYVKKLKETFNLDDVACKQLQLLFIDSINNGKLQKKEDVEYIQEDAQIIRINGLKKDGDVFQLHGAHSDRKKVMLCEKIVPIDLKSIKTQPIETVEQIKVESSKKKISIKKKM